MTRGGRRYRLLIYRAILSRWWPVILLLGLFLLVLAWPLYQQTGQSDPWRWQGMIALGVLTIGFALFLLALSHMAYVQVFPTHLKLGTPFLRLHISHKRVHRAITAEVQALFPPSQLRGWRREVIASLASHTAIVLELNRWPLSPTILRWFLSPLFFKDNSPHLVIVVDDWLRFSTELESMRSSGKGPVSPAQPGRSSILSRLPNSPSKKS